MLTREPMARMFYPAFEAVLTRLPDAGTRLLKAHRAILEALKNADAQDASSWMEKHIRDFRVGFELASLNLESNLIESIEVQRAD